MRNQDRFDLSPEATPTPLQEFADALESADYDPDDAEAVRKWRSEKYGDPAARIYRELADQMRSEIDAEIIEALGWFQKGNR